MKRQNLDPVKSVWKCEFDLAQILLNQLNVSVNY